MKTKHHIFLIVLTLFFLIAIKAFIVFFENSETERWYDKCLKSSKGINVNPEKYCSCLLTSIGQTNLDEFDFLYYLNSFNCYIKKAKINIEDRMRMQRVLETFQRDPCIERDSTNLSLINRENDGILFTIVKLKENNRFNYYNFLYLNQIFTLPYKSVASDEWKLVMFSEDFPFLSKPLDCIEVPKKNQTRVSIISDTIPFEVFRNR